MICVINTVEYARIQSSWQTASENAHREKGNARTAVADAPHRLQHFIHPGVRTVEEASECASELVRFNTTERPFYRLLSLKRVGTL